MKNAYIGCSIIEVEYLCEYGSGNMTINVEDPQNKPATFAQVMHLVDEAVAGNKSTMGNIVNVDIDARKPNEDNESPDLCDDADFMDDESMDDDLDEEE